MIENYFDYKNPELDKTKFSEQALFEAMLAMTIMQSESGRFIEQKFMIESDKGEKHVLLLRQNSTGIELVELTQNGATNSSMSHDTVIATCSCGEWKNFQIFLNTKANKAIDLILENQFGEFKQGVEHGDKYINYFFESEKPSLANRILLYTPASCDESVHFLAAAEYFLNQKDKPECVQQAVTHIINNRSFYANIELSDAQKKVLAKVVSIIMEDCSYSQSDLQTASILMMKCFDQLNRPQIRHAQKWIVNNLSNQDLASAAASAKCITDHPLEFDSEQSLCARKFILNNFKDSDPTNPENLAFFILQRQKMFGAQQIEKVRGFIVGLLNSPDVKSAQSIALFILNNPDDFKNRFAMIKTFMLDNLADMLRLNRGVTKNQIEKIRAFIMSDLQSLDVNRIEGLVQFIVANPGSFDQTQVQAIIHFVGKKVHKFSEKTVVAVALLFIKQNRSFFEAHLTEKTRQQFKEFYKPNLAVIESYSEDLLTVINQHEQEQIQLREALGQLDIGVGKVSAHAFNAPQVKWIDTIKFEWPEQIRLFYLPSKLLPRQSTAVEQLITTIREKSIQDLTIIQERLRVKGLSDKVFVDKSELRPVTWQSIANLWLSGDFEVALHLDPRIAQHLLENLSHPAIALWNNRSVRSNSSVSQTVELNSSN